MFVNTRDTGGRRRNKVYTGTTAARSSKTSLLSVFTVGSVGSAGSNSTITQDSYDRSNNKRRRRPKEQRVRTRRPLSEDKNRSVDVFDFLVEAKASKESLKLTERVSADVISVLAIEEADEESHEANNWIDENEDKDEIRDEDSDGQSDEEDVPPKIIVHTDDADPEIYYRSMSDSGISMGSSSIDASLASLPGRLPALPEECSPRPSSQQRMGNELTLFDPRWTWNTSPGPFHDGYIPPPAPVPPQMMCDVPHYPSYPPYTPYGTPPPMPEEEIRGPAIKIREPSQREIKPKCFRSFTKVSTRLILQLQDDIAELEGELSVLDSELDAIESESGSDDGIPAHPGTAKHMLKARETEIYQELQYKLEQYRLSLEGMQKIEDMSQPAVLSDLTQHHRWLESRITPPLRARHLVGNDLRVFSTVKPKESVISPSHDTQFVAYTALIDVLLPLIAFKLVTSMLSRFILLIIVFIISITVQERTKKNIRTEDMKCILICTGVSLFAAIFL